MKRKFISNDAGIDWFVNLFISALTYEEYNRLGEYAANEYLSFRFILFHWLSKNYLTPKYDFHEMQKAINERLEEYRKKGGKWNLSDLLDDVKDNFFIKTPYELLLEMERESHFKKQEKMWEKRMAKQRAQLGTSRSL